MVTDEHFAAAIAEECVEDAGTDNAAQNAAQQSVARARAEANEGPLGNEKSLDFPGFSADCDFSREDEVEDRGLEPLTSCMPCKRSPN